MRLVHRRPILSLGLGVLCSVLGVLCIAAFNVSSGAFAQSSGPIVVPPIPDPVAVTVDHTTTALIVADFNASDCPDRPPCAVGQPIASLLAKARAAGATVIFSTYSSSVLPPPSAAPLPGEIVMVRPHSGSPWEGTNEVLQAANVKTVVFTGNALDDVIIWGSYALANAYGNTVVVPEDASYAADAYRTAATFFKLLDLGNASRNLNNTPLQPKAVTLTRSDLVTFQ